MRWTGPLESAALLTVLPVPARAAASTRGVLPWAPLVGLALGGAAAGAAVLGDRWVSSLVGAVLAVAVLALLTRGLHLDGLADTADGLGCYGRPQRALAVMRDGSTGPFGVAALVLVLTTQAAALGALAETGRLAAVLLAVAAGRVAFSWCARTGVPSARPEGLGALVAGSQPPAVAVAWSAALLAGGLMAVPGRAWQGALAVGVAALVILAFSAHTRRRFGGVTGDVLGAASELTTTVVLAVCALS